ncbi:MAG: FAD-binding oxidoreductase [Chloroflexota bacterium]
MSQSKDETYAHKWGFKDTRFVANPDFTVTVTGDRYEISGTTMPEFLPFVEEMLDIKIDLNDRKTEVENKPIAQPHVNDAFCKTLTDTFPSSQYTQDNNIRLVHSHGQTTADEVNRVLYDQLDRTVDLVFYPESEADVQKIIDLAEEHNVCLVPYGGGTSVSSALQLPLNEKRMIVAVSMMRLNQIEWFDKENYRICVQAGMTGKQLEKVLAKEGFTCGHEPDSMELSTVGGWIATNASGMKKNRYGNIEDIVENVTMITPNGTLTHAQNMPRTSIGIRPDAFFFGSEGNLGLITKAVLKVHKLPEKVKFASFVFPNFKYGVAFLYDLTRSGTIPASVRLLDNIQFRFGSALKPTPTSQEKMMSNIQKFFLLNVKGFDPDKLCAATVVMEGSSEEVEFQNKVINRIGKKHQGIAGGEGNGKRGYKLTYAIAYIRDFLANFHIIGETYETTVAWDKIEAVIDAVAERAVELHADYNLPGKAYVSPRISQVYHTGVCIYFTHGFSTKGVENPEKVFSEIEHSLRQTIMEAGGSVSHHHGVGKIRKDFMKQTLSPATINLIKDIKKANDPKNIFGIRNNVFAE